MKILILLLFFQIMVFAQEDALNKISLFSKTPNDLKHFCVGKHDDFCSAEALKMSMSIIQKQLDELQKNVERERKEQIRKQKIKNLNKIKTQRMLKMLREHFLDRQF